MSGPLEFNMSEPLEFYTPGGGGGCFSSFMTFAWFILAAFGFGFGFCSASPSGP